MDPEDDFQTWMFIFTSSVEADGDYKFFVPGYCRLVDQILENNQLSGVLENYTSNFLHEVCPIVLRKILNISYVYGEEKEIITNFLQKTSLLVSWAFCDQNNMELFNSLSIVFDGSQTYYSRNWNTVPTKYDVEKISEYFIENSGLDKMKNYILNEEVKIEHFQNYFSLFQSPYSGFYSKIESHAIPLIQKFLTELEKLEPDNPKLQQISILTIKLFSNSSSSTESITIKKSELSYNTDTGNEEDSEEMITVNAVEYFYTKLLNFGEKLIMQNDKLPVKITGAIILSAICELSQLAPSHCFKKWKKTTKLCDYLSNSDTHTALLSKIEPVFVAIIDRENIIKLWSIAIHAHASQRTTLMSIVAKALKTVDINDAKAFLDEASKDGSDDTIEFLIQTFYSSIESKSNFGIYVFSKILGIDPSLNHQTTIIKTPSRTNSVNFDPEDIKAVQNPPEENTIFENIAEKINPLITYQIPSSFRTKMVETCLKQLKEKKNPKLISKILGKLATVTYRGENIFQSTFADDILTLIKEIPEAKDDLFSVLLTTYQRLKDTIDEETLDQFTKVGESDLLWGFIENKIITNGYTALNNNECYEKLANILEQQSKNECSPALISLIIKFVLIYAYKERYIESKYNSVQIYSIDPLPTFPARFRLTKFPLPYMDLLYNVLQNTNNKDVINSCIAALLKIFCKARKNKEATEKCLELFSSSQNENAKLNILTLLFRFTFKINQKVNPEDLGIIYHKKPTYRIVDYNNGEISKKKEEEINLIIRFKDEERVISIARTAKPELLRTRLSNIYHISEYSFDMIDQFNQNFIRHQTLISVPNNSIITIKVANTYHDYLVIPIIESPIQILNEIHFQDTLFPLLEKFKNNSDLIYIVKLFLNLLPNSPFILKLLDTPQLFMKKLNEYTQSHNIISQKYMLQILQQRIDADSQEARTYIKEGLFDFCVSNLKSISLCQKPNLTKICLQLLNDHIEQQSPIDDKIIQTIIVPLINMFDSRKDNADTCFLLLNKFAIYQNNLVLSLIFDGGETQKLFIENIQKINKDSWSIFKIFCNKLPQKMLFDICLEKIEDECYDFHYIELFAETIPFISSEISIDTLIFKCISILIKTKSNDLCKAILLLLKNSSANHSTEIINPEPEEHQHVKIDSFGSLANDLFIVAMQIDNEETQENFFQLILQLGFTNPEPVYAIINSISSERWNIRTRDYRKSELGYTGLRNLGATCYMNSIIQQMFFIKPFLKTVIETNLTKEGHKEFQYILTQLEKTKRKYVDTQNFVKNWLAWDKKPVNPKEQQDAFEFLQLILDQMPSECNHFFKGSIKNIVKSVNEEDNFESANDEDFYTIPLEVKNYKDVESSFQVFLQSETFEGYNAESLGRKIDIQKFARIGKAPPILVLQLKRFEYDLQTLNRVKINDRYEFPQEINISELMYRPNNDQTTEQLSKYDYTLKGVVLHAGTAQGGHYNSLVKINNDWVLFNDQDVSILPPDKFEYETFGGRTSSSTTTSNTSLTNDLSFDDYDSYPSAYLLVYQQEDNQEFSNFDSSSILFNNEFLQQIEADNKEFLKNQAIFSDAFFEFSASTLKLNPLPYIFNIFCHSSLTNKIHQLDSLISNFFSLQNIPYLSGSIQTHQKINEFINDGQISPRVFTLFYLLEHFDKILKIFLSSCPQEIINSIQVIFDEVFKIKDDSLSTEIFQSADLFIQSLSNSLQVWRNIPRICETIHNFCMHQVTIAIQNKVQDSLIQFIDLVYNPTYMRSSVIIQNINLTNLFKSLQILCFYSDFDTAIIQKYSQNIIQSSEQTKAFIGLFKRLINLKKADPMILISILLSMKTYEEKIEGVRMVCNIILEMFSKKTDKNEPNTNQSIISSSSSENESEAEEDEEEISNEERRKEILSIVPLFDICQQKKCIHNLFIEFIKNLMIPNEACIRFFDRYPDFILNYLSTNDYAVNFAAEHCFLFLFPQFKKIETTPDLPYSKFIYPNNDITNINQYFTTKTQFLTLSDTVTSNNAKTRRRLQMFYNLFTDKIQEFVKNPKQCYMPQEQAENLPYNDKKGAFYAAPLLRCYNFTIRTLQKDGDKEYNLIMALLKSFEDLNIQGDDNMAACIEIVFTNKFSNDSFVILSSQSILLQNKTLGCLDEYERIFEMLKMQDRETQIQFFESKCINHLSECLLDLTQDKHKALLRNTFDLVVSLNSERTQRFLSLLFGPTMVKYFYYVYDPICYGFSQCSHLLDTSIVITFCSTLVKFLILSGKELTSPTIYQYPFENINLGLNALIEDKRWMYEIEDTQLELNKLINHFTYHRNMTFLQSLLKFIILSIPVFSNSRQCIESIINQCKGNLPMTQGSEGYTDILIITLNCMLLINGDDCEGFIASNIRTDKVLSKFYIFATTKIEANAVWHDRVTRILINQEPTQETQMFVVKSVSANSTGLEICRNLCLSFQPHVEWAKYISYTSKEIYDYFSDNKEVLRSQFSSETAFKSFYDSLSDDDTDALPVPSFDSHVTM